MKRLTFVVFAVMALAAAGCGKSDSKSGGENDLVSKAKGLADRACACTDAGCIDKVANDWEAFMKAAKAGPKPDKAIRDKVEAEESRLEGCAEKIGD